MLRSVWFFLSSLISKHILILFPKSNANFRHKLYKCGTALKIFCLFIFDVLTGVALFILLCQRMNIKSQLQFIMCKNWPSLQEEYNLTWMFYVDSKRAFAYTWAHTSYWWGLVTDGDCYLNVTAAKEVLQRSRFKPMTQLEITKDRRTQLEVLG